MERRLPWWLTPRPCRTCAARAWRWCLVCGERCCSSCRIGHGWVWCCPKRPCRAGFSEAKRERRRLLLLERTLVCRGCGANFARVLVRVLEPAGPDDVMELRYVVLQHPRCSCAPMVR